MGILAGLGMICGEMYHQRRPGTSEINREPPLIRQSVTLLSLV